MSTWTLAPPFLSDGGKAWVCSLPPLLHSKTDNTEAAFQSKLRLLENGEELGPGHARHQVIRNQGGGYYSIWRDRTYFSTSDGSDPNVNGRTYTLTSVD